MNRLPKIGAAFSSHWRNRPLWCVLSVLACGVGVSLAAAQEHKGNGKGREFAREKGSGRYDRWLNEVTYIVTEEEARWWAKLQTDAERKRFIEEFWQRRNPEPGSQQNKFKEEYYRRLAYAKEHFAPCPSQADERCRIYVQYGPPDKIILHPGTGRQPPQRGEKNSAIPVERWLYGCIDGIGQNVPVDFADPSGSGERHVVIDPESLRRPTAFGIITRPDQRGLGCAGVTGQR